MKFVFGFIFTLFAAGSAHAQVPKSFQANICGTVTATSAPVCVQDGNGGNPQWGTINPTTHVFSVNASLAALPMSTPLTGCATNGGILYNNGGVLSCSAAIVSAAGNLIAGAPSVISWNGRARTSSPADGNILLQNNAAASFGLLQLGGTTNAFPAIKRNAAAVDFRLADDSAYANINGNVLTAAGSVVAGAVSSLSYGGSRARIASPADSVLLLTNNASTDFGRLQLGGTTSAFPALKRNAAAVDVRLADDTAYADLNAANITASGTITGTISTATCIRAGGILYNNGGTLACSAATASAGGAISTGNITLSSVAAVNFTGLARFSSPAVGNLLLQNDAATSFGLLQLGGTTSAFPAIKRNAAAIDLRVADDSTYAALNTGNISATGSVISTADVTLGAGNNLSWGGTRSRISSPADGNLLLRNNAATSFGLLQFGGTTSSFAAWKGTGTTLAARVADDTADADVSMRYGKTVPTTVAGLISAATAGAGSRSYVTDATACSFGSSVTGGGAIACPVFSNGTSWIGTGGTGGTTSPGGSSGQLQFNSAGSFGGTTNWTTDGTALTGAATTTIAIGGATIGSNALAVTGNANVSGSVTAGGLGVISGGSVQAAASNSFLWSGRSRVLSPADGNVLLQNNASTAFGLLQLGGTTSSFPAIKRNGAGLDVRLADDSAAANLTAATITANGSVLASSALAFSARSRITSNVDGNLTLQNNATTSFGLLQFGGTTSSFAAIKSTGTTLAARVADDTADATMTALTQSSVDNSNKVATTAFVQTNAAGLQPLNTNLTALSGLTGAADKVAYFTGAGAMSTTDLTSFARTLNGSANSAAFLTALGFQFSLGGSGYLKFPNGLTVQWGVDGSGTSGLTTVTLPTACPTSGYPVMTNVMSTSTATITANVQNLTTTTFQMDKRFNSGTAAPVSASDNFSWFVICS